MTSSHKIAFLRYLAFGIDWLVIAVWAGVLYAIVMLSFSGQPPSPSGPWAGQALGFVSMTLPIIFYFSICEANTWRATLGKRIMSLCVNSTKPEAISFKRIILRNVVKFAPWELGHLVANQVIFSSSSSIPIWVYVPMILSFAIPLWWVISIFVRGNSPYDLLTGIHITLYDRKAVD
jgi:uncharacterized RDD family membrane protein YckC